MTVEQRREESDDEFPVGMRVLAVDDDPICLRLLETLLRKCQYHVTTTSQAIRALEMLRENKNKFDLVISDVHMPDMDGFKLLELVGLEMDLPVIMLSANGDTKLVMKGITHGACDYLVKPVRMEELKNIWQHVVRRKRFDSSDHQSFNSHGKNSGERNGTGSRNSNTDPKLCKKRKDQNSDDDDDDDDDNSDNENENEDPSTQKRPRVVWSVELHRKFVAAVNQLGLDKAVPKKILELMNVEKLTRENVASHLQKYRLYLKRISSVANQQANMVAALGGPDSPYLRMNFHGGFNASPQFQNNALRSIPPSGVLARLNTPATLGLHGLAPSSMVPLGHTPIPRRPNLLPGDQTGTVLQGRPTSLEFNQLQHKRGIIGVDELCTTNDHSRIFPVSSNNPIGSVSSNSLHGLPNSSLTVQGQSQERHSHEIFGINSDMPPPNLLDHNRCNSNWPNAMENTSHDIPINISGQTRLQDSGMDGPCQTGYGLMGDNMVQNMSYAPKQVWDDNRMDLLNQADYVDGCGNTSMGTSQGAFPCAPPVLNGSASFGAVIQPTIDSIGNYGSNGAGSLEDVVTAMFKQEQDHVDEWRFPM